jgi:nitrite reductase/ring-hydroxylating ferredoxin subunit/uncharacterized membrane protein
MRSKAHIKGHPLHPLMIAFPVAFTCGSLVADVVGRIGGWPSAWATGAFLSIAAVVTGLVAGVPGFIDYLTVVPPNSSGKKRATQHMLVNVSALVAFAVGWAFRDWNTFQPGVGAMLLEVLGVGLLTWGGWMGGTLVYRNQIGVDHRYAQAGKWKEQEVTGRPGDSVAVAQADELKVDQMKLLHVNGRRIVLARCEAGYVAFDDHCTHRGGPLADGVLACNTVTCPWHGSQFDVTNGGVKAGPASERIHTYSIEQAGSEIKLRVP